MKRCATDQGLDRQPGPEFSAKTPARTGILLPSSNWSAQCPPRLRGCQGQVQPFLFEQAAFSQTPREESSSHLGAFRSLSIASFMWLADRASRLMLGASGALRKNRRASGHLRRAYPERGPASRRERPSLRERRHAPSRSYVVGTALRTGRQAR
jgi:hypothetical protein